MACLRYSFGNRRSVGSMYLTSIFKPEEEDTPKIKPLEQELEKKEDIITAKKIAKKVQRDQMKYEKALYRQGLRERRAAALYEKHVKSHPLKKMQPRKEIRPLQLDSDESDSSSQSNSDEEEDEEDDDNNEMYIDNQDQAVISGSGEMESDPDYKDYLAYLKMKSEPENKPETKRKRKDLFDVNYH